jgi:hypothetical protein
MLPFLPLCLGHFHRDETGAQPLPPGAIVIDLTSEDEEEAPSVPVPPPATLATPPLLPPDPTRRDGLFIAPSRVLVESGPSAGSLLGEPGLFTRVTIPAGAFVAFYTGVFFTHDEFMGLPDVQRQALSRYAVEVKKHGVFVSPIADAAGPDRNNVNFTRHAAAAINEPGKSGDANVFAQASLVEAIGNDDELHSFVVFCIFTCSRIEVGEELLWNYGDGYQLIRDDVGYEAGSPCVDEIIDSLPLPSPRGRVMAILRDGRRVVDALYELSLGGSDSSGEDWTPAKRRRR